MGACDEPVCDERVGGRGDRACAAERGPHKKAKCHTSKHTGSSPAEAQIMWLFVVSTIPLLLLVAASPQPPTTTTTESPDAVNPWYGSYQSEFMRLLQFTDHETLDHPVAGSAYVAVVLLLLSVQQQRSQQHQSMAEEEENRCCMCRLLIGCAVVTCIASTVRMPGVMFDGPAAGSSSFLQMYTHSSHPFCTHTNTATAIHRPLLHASRHKLAPPGCRQAAAGAQRVSAPPAPACL